MITGTWIMLLTVMTSGGSLATYALPMGSRERCLANAQVQLLQAGSPVQHAMCVEGCRSASVNRTARKGCRRGDMQKLVKLIITQGGRHDDAGAVSELHRLPEARDL
jgi:hypothetical protein